MGLLLLLKMGLWMGNGILVIYCHSLFQALKNHDNEMF